MTHPMGSLPHLHHPCDRCGYPTRYKQFPVICKCTTPDRCPHPPIDVIGSFCRRCGGPASEEGGRALEDQEHIAEIQAEQVALDAARKWPTGPALRMAPRYTAGRPWRRGGVP